MPAIKDMRTPRLAGFRAAMFGIAVTAGFFSYQLLNNGESPISRNPAVMIVFLVLCPLSLLAALNPDNIPVWIAAALLNAGCTPAFTLS